MFIKHISLSGGIKKYKNKNFKKDYVDAINAEHKNIKVYILPK